MSLFSDTMHGGLLAHRNWRIQARLNVVRPLVIDFIDHRSLWQRRPYVQARDSPFCRSVKEMAISREFAVAKNERSHVVNAASPIVANFETRKKGKGKSNDDPSAGKQRKGNETFKVAQYLLHSG
ncbi:hypothetical protein M514_17814 [Trichuris suis]|uniref:Uncharacterized protein n=1 Tax=Trichuris suis TaxID=68888 RepID=A0A085NKF9_9BILA|nr:hypothetical protein M514_17814 [Trichuris suis]